MSNKNMSDREIYNFLKGFAVKATTKPKKTKGQIIKDYIEGKITKEQYIKDMKYYGY